MPIVGIDSSAVICGGQLARNTFENDGERPGVGHRVGVGKKLVGGALYLVPPHSPDGLGPQPDVPHRGNLGFHQGLDRSARSCGHLRA